MANEAKQSIFAASSNQPGHLPPNPTALNLS
jgi:hypothetical protein